MTPKQRRRKKVMDKQKHKKAIKIMSLIAAAVCAVMILTGCAGHQKGDTYKIMLGNKCAANGTIQSPIWFHTTLGPKQVAKDNCEK